MVSISFLLASSLSVIALSFKTSASVPSLLLVSDPTFSSLLQQLYTAEFELDKVKTAAGEKSETVLLAEDKIHRLKSDIRENISNIRSNFSTERNSINANIALNNNLLAQVPQKERGLLEISRQQAIKNNIYSYRLTLMGKR